MVFLKVNGWFYQGLRIIKEDWHNGCVNALVEKRKLFWEQILEMGEAYRAVVYKKRWLGRQIISVLKLQEKDLEC